MERSSNQEQFSPIKNLDPGRKCFYQVTPISIVLIAVTGDCDLYMADVGVASKKSRSHGGFLPWSLGHQEFSSTVTGSPGV